MAMLTFKLTEIQDYESYSLLLLITIGDGILAIVLAIALVIFILGFVGGW
jgi:hypothetical protein